MKGVSRIVHIALGHNPTDDRIFFKEARSLVKMGYQVTIVAPDREQVTEKDGVRFVRYKETNYWRNLLSAYRAARELRADIYHLHEFELIPFGIWLKYKYRRKVIYDAHETIFWYFIDFSKRSLLIKLPLAIIAQMLEWLGAGFLDWVIAVTPRVAEGFKFFQKRITLIYNYPLTDVFNLSRNTNTERPIILFHGQIVPGRNIELMIKAMAHVNPQVPNARLVIVGHISDWYRQQLESLVTKLNLRNAVEFQPAIRHEQVPMLISTASIGLSSMMPNESYKRSIQVKPFEFMAMGIPVLGCRVPSIETYVEKTGAGIIIDPLTPANLGTQICNLLSNPTLRLKLGQQGRLVVQTQFNWSKMEPVLAQIYKELNRFRS